jgi:hypothetical protein
MFRWAGDATEWTEYALHLPPQVAAALFGPDCLAQSQSPLGCPALHELQGASGCKMWLDKETLMGREEPFLVFLRGPAGQPSNAHMNDALELVSNKMKELLQQQQQQQQQNQSQQPGQQQPQQQQPPPPSQQQQQPPRAPAPFGAPGRPPHPPTNAWGGVGSLNAT